MSLPLAPVVVNTATKTLTKYDFGTLVVLSRAAGSAVTLPAPAADAELHFVVGIAPTTAYTIGTNGGANIIAGGVNELEVDTSDDGPYLADGDLVTFVANVAVVGDFVKLRSDGTTWFLSGQTNADGGVTIAKT